MTVPTTAADAGPYAGNGATTAFPFGFKALTDAEVQVRVNGVAISSALYTVTLAAVGGTVTFATAPASGAEITIVSMPSFKQDVDFENNGAFLQATHDEVADRGAVRDIYLKRRVDVVMPESLLLDASRPGKFLAFDVDGVAVPAVGTGVDSALRTDLAATTGGALVGFNILSANARLRSLADKLRETPSVYDFEGIHGDGVSSDYTAIQNAIDHVAGTGQALLLPAPSANYRASGLVVAHRNFRLIGESWEKTIIDAINSDPIMILAAGYGLIEGIGFQGGTDASTPVAQHCLVAQDSNQTRISECGAYWADEDGLHFDPEWDGASAGNNNNVKVLGGDYILNGRDGIGMIQHPDNNASWLEMVNASSNMRHGILQKGEGHAVVGGNIFANGGDGVKWGEAADSSSTVNGLVWGAWIEANFGVGVRGSSQSSRNVYTRKNQAQGYTGDSGATNILLRTSGAGVLDLYGNGTDVVQVSGNAADTIFLSGGTVSGSGNRDLWLTAQGAGALTMNSNVNVRPTFSLQFNGTTALNGVQTGWGTPTGTMERTTFASYTAATAGVSYDQTIMQNALNALQNVSRRLAAMQTDLVNNKVPHA